MKAEKNEINRLDPIASKPKKTLGVDADGIQKTMTLKHYLGDGASMVAVNSISGLAGMLTFFYTDKIGLAAAAVGTIMLLTRILDAFIDLMMGKIVDSTKSKYGKARPWFLWMIVPAIASIILLFTVPVSASDSVKYVYAFVTITLATGFVYSAIAIPLGSLMALRTRSTEERGKMGITRAAFGYAIGMAVAIFLIPMSNMLGGDQKAWIIIGVTLGILSGLALLTTFLSSEEKVDGDRLKETAEEDRVTFRESIRLLFKNKYWVIMLFINILYQMSNSISGSTNVYYTKYILGNENLVGVMGAVGLLPVLIGFALVGPMIKKYGITRTAQIGFLIGIASTGIRCFMPYSFLGALIFGSFSTFAMIPMMAVSGVLLANTIEYGEWQSGKRIVGMANSGSSFGQKVGMGIGTAMIGWILAFGSYDGTLAVQSDSAIASILALTIYLPFALFVVSYLLLRKYDLDKKYPQIVKELEARKQANN